MEQYAYASGLRNSNAAFKTGFSMAVLLLCIILDRMPVSAFVILSMLALSVGAGKVSLADYIRLLFIPLFFILFGGIALIFTTGDLRQAAEVTMRALGAVSAFYFLILSTPVSEILTVLRKCHVPGILIELMYLVYRFIFVLTDVWRSMNTAAQSRLGYADYRTSLRTFGGIAGNLLVLSMKKADAYYDAMVSRGYEGDLCFLEEEKPCRMREWLGAVCYIGVLVLIRRICG
jgi:cobalt/nickel transport system permease protein